jgi:hypothetical protein
VHGRNLAHISTFEHYIGSGVGCFPCSKAEACVSERPVRELWYQFLSSLELTSTNL